MRKILFIIDEVELKYFEFNDLVTNFWFIKEFLQRDYSVDISVKNQLYIKNSVPYANSYKSFLDAENGISYDKECISKKINDYDVVFFRPDPPVDINYINACHIFDFVDREKTLLINDPYQIKNFGEKFHITKFSEYTPKNIITSQKEQILEFVEQEEEAVIKPLNQCFGQGVFYLNKNDKNLNSIIKTATNDFKSMVMIQKYLEKAKFGDKRVLLINGKVMEECIIKLPGENDFKFNTHSDKFFEGTKLTETEKNIAQDIAERLKEIGLYLVGLDMLDEKVIEINVTSPCYFIREINNLYNINFENKIFEHIEQLINQRVLQKVCC